MKAITCTEYGPPDVLRYAEVDRPAPKDNEVLVKVRAASINPYDWHCMRGSPFPVRMMLGLRRPKDPRVGVDVAGEVEAVGKDVTQFRPGDAVFGGCRGALAEYTCATEETLAAKPVNLSFEQAAAVYMAALTALQGLRGAGRLQPGQKVLVDGASGGVGTFAVQIAKALGAEVTAVCGPGNVERVRSLGASKIIDYSREDFTRNWQQYDLILAPSAYHPIFDYRRALSSQGHYVMIGGGGVQILQAMFLGPWLSMIGSKKLEMMMTKRNKQDLLYLKELLESGKITPIIDRLYPLSQAAEAVRYLEQGHAKGKVVITV
jgi:NADPH:quinone reductase-like Zn-dependent oxidoreductase